MYIGGAILNSGQHRDRRKNETRWKPFGRCSATCTLKSVMTAKIPKFVVVWRKNGVLNDSSSFLPITVECVNNAFKLGKYGFTAKFSFCPGHGVLALRYVKYEFLQRVLLFLEKKIFTRIHKKTALFVIVKKKNKNACFFLTCYNA